MTSEVHPDHRADPVRPEIFRDVFGRVPTAVAVLSTLVDAVPHGVAVGSFVSVSLDPPLVGFFIAATSATWPILESSGGFCASILRGNQAAVSRSFATKGADRFAACPWTPAPSGRPILDGAVAWIDCDVESTAPAGDHVVVLGRVSDLGTASTNDPLVFLGGRYGTVSVLDEPASRGW